MDLSAVYAGTWRIDLDSPTRRTGAPAILIPPRPRLLVPALETTPQMEVT